MGLISNQESCNSLFLSSFSTPGPVNIESKVTEEPLQLSTCIAPDSFPICHLTGGHCHQPLALSRPVATRGIWVNSSQPAASWWQYLCRSLSITAEHSQHSSPLLAPFLFSPPSSPPFQPSHFKSQLLAEVTSSPLQEEISLGHSLSAGGKIPAHFVLQEIHGTYSISAGSWNLNELSYSFLFQVMLVFQLLFPDKPSSRMSKAAQAAQTCTVLAKRALYHSAIKS